MHMKERSIKFQVKERIKEIFYILLTFTPCVYIQYTFIFYTKSTQKKIFYHDMNEFYHCNFNKVIKPL